MKKKACNLSDEEIIEYLDSSEKTCDYCDWKFDCPRGTVCYGDAPIDTPCCAMSRKNFDNMICENFKDECGAKSPMTKDLSVREWDCSSCGAHHDRDENAAINIHREGMRIYFLPK